MIPHVVVRIVSFPDDWPQILPISRFTINQPCVDMQEMNPYLVVATLVGRSDAASFMRNFERSMHANMPLTLATVWLDEPTHIGQFSWNSTWSHNRAGRCGIGKLVLANASSSVLSRRWASPDRRRHAAPSKSPATMSTCS